MKEPARTGGRPPPLSRERIVAAAMTLADQDGTDRLTMRALAGRLGFEAMSLYNHVRDKDDLLDAMVEAVVGAIERPAALGDWRDAMRRRALSMRSAFLAHPWAPNLIVSRLNAGPAMLDLTDATLGCLRSAGFTYAEADHVWNAVDSHVYGFHLIERSFPLEPDSFARAARQFLPVLSADRHPHLRELTALVADGRHSGINEFTFGLDLLLDALERWRAVTRDRPYTAS